MGWQIIRYAQQNTTQWGVVRDGTVTPVPGTYAALAEFLTDGGAEHVRTLGHDADQAPSIPLASVEPLSPVTTPCRIICQGTNYQAHRQETGTHHGFNLLFAKADSSLTSARGPVIRPRGVQLLDYELELGLVVGRAITGPIQVQADRLEDVIAGLSWPMTSRPATCRFPRSSGSGARASARSVRSGRTSTYSTKAMPSG